MDETTFFGSRLSSTRVEDTCLDAGRPLIPHGPPLVFGHAIDVVEVREVALIAGRQERAPQIREIRRLVVRHREERLINRDD